MLEAASAASIAQPATSAALPAAVPLPTAVALPAAVALPVVPATPAAFGDTSHWRQIVVLPLVSGLVSFALA